VLSSFEHESMRVVHEIDPSIATGLIYLGKPTLLLEQLRYTGASSLSMHHAFVTREFVEQMADEGIDVGVWTVDEPEALRRMTALHPRIRITTNHPDRLMEVLA
jgi:glycerophosphoryl diester phosphodiesterase